MRFSYGDLRDSDRIPLSGLPGLGTLPSSGITGVPPCLASPSPSLLPLTTLSDVEMGSNPPASRVLRYKRVLHWPAFPFFLETILLCNSEWLQTHNLYFQDPSAQITGLCQRPRTVEPKSLRHL